MAILLYTAMFVSILIFPGECSSAARQAMTIWGRDVVPSLFPFMVLCRMVSSKLSTLDIPASASIIVLGLIGGSPSGAAAMQAFSGHTGSSHSLKKIDILPLCALTGTISPMFFLGSLSSWLGEPATSLRIMASHYGGAVMCALLLRFFIPKMRADLDTGIIEATVADDSPIRQSVDAILHVGGCIIFYSVAAAMVQILLPLSDASSAAIHAFLEAAGGMHALSGLRIADNVTSVLLAFSSGFSGLSILSQNLMFVRAFGVKLRHLIAIGILRGLFSAMIMGMLGAT